MSGTTEEVGTGLGVPRNYVRPCIALLLAEGPAHGYELLSQLPALGFDRADAGGLYRTLRVMEDEGLVASRWEHGESGPARRMYELTDEGLEWLHLWAGSVRDMRRRLSRFLRQYRSVADEAAAQT